MTSRAHTHKQSTPAVEGAQKPLNPEVNAKPSRLKDIEGSLLTMKEVTAATGISRTSIYRLARAGEIEVVKLAGRSRVVVDSLRTYVDGAAASRFKPEGVSSAAR